MLPVPPRRFGNPVYAFVASALLLGVATAHAAPEPKTGARPEVAAANTSSAPTDLNDLSLRVTHLAAGGHQRVQIDLSGAKRPARKHK